MSNSVLQRPAARFLCSAAVGTFAPAVVLALVALCFGAVPTPSILLSTLPLSLLLATLAALSWPILRSESTATRYFVSIFLPTGMAFCATALLNILGGPQGRFDTSFIVFNVIWALIASCPAAVVYHILERRSK